MNTAAKSVSTICGLIPLSSSSYPPLNPIASKRFIENNFGKGAGISSSDLKKIASIPRKKKSTGGFNIFDKIRLEFMFDNPNVCN
jgi:hypothetical protein